MIDFSKWSEYTSDQKQKKMPWIVAIAYWLVSQYKYEEKQMKG